MKSNQEGFSYIDVLIGITILLVGVLALAAAVTASVIRAREGEQQLNAKNLASSTMESIFSARDINTLGWDAIGNKGSNLVNGVAKGVFLVGPQPVLPDDGVDNVVGTDDDTGTALVNFSRQITITDVCDPERPSANCPTPGTNPVMIRQVDVTIFYRVGKNLQRQEKATTVITNYYTTTP
jgi:type II secretory pathway pseudopilin PulG